MNLFTQQQENLSLPNSKSKKKKTVQTTFFKPQIIKEKQIDKELQDVIEELNDLELENLTPVDAMKKLIEFKEKLEKSN